MRMLRLALLAATIAVAPHGASAQSAPSSTPSSEPKAARATLATAVDDELPSWLRFGGEYRFRFEGQTGIKGGRGVGDAYVLSRLRLDLLFRLGSHVRVFVQAQDSQAGAFNANPDPSVHQNDFDLRQGYVEVRQAEKGGWTVRAGRQELSYDDQRLVGASNWTNTARAFDAVKVGYSDARLAVDAFVSSVVVPADDRFDHHVDGQNLYGVHASMLRVVPDGELVGYWYWKTSPLVAGERAGLGDADVHTVGARVVGALTPSADYAVDVIGQRGSYAGDRIRAGAAHAQLGYVVTRRAWSPKARIEYTFATGDASPSDGVRGTFDQLYPTNHAKYGVMDQVGLRNIHVARVGVTVKPYARLTVEADYHSFWLAHRRDGLYDASGALLARVSTGASGAHVAQEADLVATCAVATNVSVGAGYGRWLPGAFWKHATPGSSRHFTYSFVSYRF